MMTFACCVQLCGASYTHICSVTYRSSTERSFVAKSDPMVDLYRSLNSPLQYLCAAHDSAPPPHARTTERREEQSRAKRERERRCRVDGWSGCHATVQ
jgi:hypothetical protein